MQFKIDSETRDVVLSNSGDLITVQGIDEKIQNVTGQLLVRYGHDKYDLEYGTDYPTIYKLKNTSMGRAFFKGEIIKAFREEGIRVRSVTFSHFLIPQTTVHVEFYDDIDTITIEI